MQRFSSRSSEKEEGKTLFQKIRQWFIGRRNRISLEETPFLTSIASRVDLKRLQQAIQCSIHHPHLFVQAMIHRSYLQYLNDPNATSNERLEFLGDAILNIIVADFLFSHRPDDSEGELTVLRSRLVNRKALVHCAKEIQLWDHLMVGPGTSNRAEKGAETIVADAFEALIGAIYLDSGLEAARAFTLRQLLSVVKKGLLSTENENYKSTLLEYAQSKGLGIPRYAIVKEIGPDHDRTFTAEVMLENKPIGKGEGKNKKEAEQAAAEQGMRALERQKFKP